MLISESFGDVLEPGLRAIFDLSFQQVEQMMPLLFNVQTSSTSYEKMSSLGGMGDFTAHSGTIQYDDVYQGEDVRWNHKAFSKGMKIDRELYDDDLYNVIAIQPRKMGIAAARTREKHAASVFNNGSTGDGDITIDGTTIQDHSHGDPLFDADHSLGSDRDTTSTQSNTGTLTLSATSVETTRRNMAGFVDDTSDFISVTPDLLLVPRNLEETAYEIISSSGKVDVATNNSNFHFGKYRLAVWQRLTDSNNWYMIDSALMKLSLHWWDRIPLEFFQQKDFDTLAAKYGAYMRYSFGWSDYRFIHAQIPTGS